MARLSGRLSLAVLSRREAERMGSFRIFSMTREAAISLDRSATCPAEPCMSLSRPRPVAARGCRAKGGVCNAREKRDPSPPSAPPLFFGVAFFSIFFLGVSPNRRKRGGGWGGVYVDPLLPSKRAFYPSRGLGTGERQNLQASYSSLWETSARVPTWAGGTHRTKGQFPESAPQNLGVDAWLKDVHAYRQGFRLALKGRAAHAWVAEKTARLAESLGLLEPSIGPPGLGTWSPFRSEISGHMATAPSFCAKRSRNSSRACWNGAS